MTDLIDNEVSAQAAPGPYDTVDVGCGAGFHTYIVDRNGRKIGVVWGPRAEKVWTAALFAGAPDMLAALKVFQEAYEAQSDEYCSQKTNDANKLMIAVLAKVEGGTP